MPALICFVSILKEIKCFSQSNNFRLVTVYVHVYQNRAPLTLEKSLRFEHDTKENFV
jgi:hypothetical protein